MIPTYLEQLEEKVRAAVTGRRFTEVARLSAEFSESAFQYSETLPAGDPRRDEARRRTVDLISWSLVMLRGARAACAAELRKVSAANNYSRQSAARSQRTPGVSLDA
jgi:hypothetical protein